MPKKNDKPTTPAPQPAAPQPRTEIFSGVGEAVQPNYENDPHDRDVLPLSVQGVEAFPINVDEVFPDQGLPGQPENPNENVPPGIRLRRYKVWIENYKKGIVHPVTGLCDKAEGLAFPRRPMAEMWKRPATAEGAQKYYGVPSGFLTAAQLRHLGLSEVPEDFVGPFPRPRNDLTAVLFRGVVVEAVNERDAEYRYMKLFGVTRADHWHTERVEDDHPLGFFDRLRKTSARRSA